ncbi:MAG TPA: type II secretion system F family protein [Candidatus Krumholzibacteria bacterium]|nr:type II secretion system F family protein [Candidatus Krumholzibacteria bacterium]
MMLLIITALTALTFLALFAGVYHLRARNASSERLQRMVTVDTTAPVDDAFLDSTMPFWLRPVAFLGWLLPMQVYSDTLKWELAQAGFRHLEARPIYAGTRVLSTLVVGLGTTLAVWGLRLKADELALVVGTAVAVGYLLPVVIMRMRQSSRQTEITQGLPDALDLLVICVEAGQGLNAALIKVGKEMMFTSPALSQDLMIVNNEMRAGISRTQALRNLSLRTGVDDVRALVAVMIQSDRFGTSVAQALRIHAGSLRTRRRQRAEEKARKAPIKLLFPLVFCIFPELLVVILAPGMIQLFRALSQH